MGGRGIIKVKVKQVKDFFKLKKHNVSIKNEIMAGFTSFFAAVYIIIVNASILSDGGVPLEPLIIATVFSSLLGCFLVAFLSNTPLIIMPGMGINALFTYTIVNTLHLNFNEALAVVVVSGILFIIIAITPISKILMQAIPNNLKESITVGIGLFITFIGLQKANIVIADSSTLIRIGNIHSKEVLAFIIIMIITLVLFLKNVPGTFLISITLGTIISSLFGLLDISGINFSMPNISSYNEIFFNVDFSRILSPNFWIATFSLTLVLVFENIGLLYGQVSGMLDAPEKTPGALKSIALSVVGCGLLGSSPCVSTVEGAAGIATGGRTGLTSITTGTLFLLSLFLIPLIKIIPNAAISPILIIIGGLMIQNLRHINFDDFSELFPAFITIIMIPFTYSIIDGIALGFILYPICKIVTKKSNEISISMYVISAIFLIYFFIHGINF